MWQRFTERARRVVFYAQEEAGKYGDSEVSPEHMLLGLLRDRDTTADRVMSAMGVDPPVLRAEVEEKVPRGPGVSPRDEFSLTNRAKRVIDLAYDEARALNNNYIGTEHLLLAFARDKDGLVGAVLGGAGLEVELVRQAAAQAQAGEDITVKAASRPASAASEGQPQDPSMDRLVARFVSSCRTDPRARLDSYLRTSDAARDMAGTDLPDIRSLARPQIEAIFEATRVLKKELSPETQRGLLAGTTMAMIFEKPSLRTRVSFEAGIFQLGGHGIYLAPADISLGKRESVADVAHNLERMCQIIMARVFEHEKITQLAEAASVPVINGLSDLEHPCQALADFYTILEKNGELSGLKLAFIGDGNNVAHSLMLLAAKVGTSFAIACPSGYEPADEVVAASRAFAAETGATIEITSDPVAAVRDADAVYTDVWASMGQEAEAEERAKLFAAYQVNAALMARAEPDAIFLHCLPAHRGSEVTDEVIDGLQSVVFDEAENRMHVQKAVMALVAAERRA